MTFLLVFFFPLILFQSGTILSLTYFFIILTLMNSTTDCFVEGLSIWVFVLQLGLIDVFLMIGLSLWVFDINTKESKKMSCLFTGDVNFDHLIKMVLAGLFFPFVVNNLGYIFWNYDNILFLLNFPPATLSILWQILPAAVMSVVFACYWCSTDI